MKPSAARLNCELDIRFGLATPSEANVFVEYRGDNAEGVTLSGQVYGPFCDYARTLPAKAPLRAASSKTTNVMKAFVPDPCFWTPAGPFWYDVQVELRRDGKVIESVRRMQGIRPLVCRGRSLYLEGRRWVVRGAATDEENVAELSAWHEAGAAAMVTNPSDTFCEAASRAGVFVIAVVEHADVAGERARLARWPAVGIAVVASPPLAISRPGNLLLGTNIESIRELEPDTAIDVAICADVQTHGPQLAKVEIPLIALRSGKPRSDPAEVRRMCDDLQREFAHIGDFAGYVV